MIDARAPVIVFETLDSTNEEARRRGDSGESGPVWLLARTQTAGRGRRGRHWASTPGAFLGSYLGHTQEPPGRIALLSLAAGVAVVGALGACGAPGARLKWPNDVFFNGGKAAGILVESSAAPNGGWWFAVGIGVNLASAPAGLDQPTAAAAGVPVERFHAALSASLCHWAAGVGQARIEALRAAWLSHALGIGQTVRASLGAETIVGQFLDLDNDGALLMQTDRGIVRIAAGEVFFPDLADG